MNFCGFVKKYKWELLVYYALLFVILSAIFFPIIMNISYEKLTDSDRLAYLGSCLAAIGTTLLASIAIWQNHVIGRQNEKLNEPFFNVIEGSIDSSSAEIVLINTTTNIATQMIISKALVTSSKYKKGIAVYSTDLKNIFIMRGNDEKHFSFQKIPEDDPLMLTFNIEYYDVFQKHHRSKITLHFLFGCLAICRTEDEVIK